MSSVMEERVLKVLQDVGGWMTAGAIWNRIDWNCKKAHVDHVLASLVADGVVQEIHGITNAEFALEGAAKPAGYQEPSKPVQLDAEKFVAEPPPAGRPRTPGVTPPPSPVPPRPVRQEPVLEMSVEEIAKRIVEHLDTGVTATATELATLLGTQSPRVLYALQDMGKAGRIERFGYGKGTRYRKATRKPPQTPAPTPAPRQAEKPAAPVLRTAMKTDPVAEVKSWATEKTTISKAVADQAALDILAAQMQAAANAPQSAPAAQEAPAAPVTAPKGASAPAAAAAGARTRFALFSTGELVIERRGAAEPFVLDPGETAALVAYLDRLVPAEASA